MNDLVNKITGSWIESEDIHSDCLFVAGNYIGGSSTEPICYWATTAHNNWESQADAFITSSLEVWVSSSGCPVSSSVQVLKLMEEHGVFQQEEWISGSDTYNSYYDRIYD